jgi:alpha-glucosidase
LTWWKQAVIYQIYPRSFQDSTGDGVGDLPGITQRLDDVQWLGADAIWLSPIFTSPMADFGYDVADYTDIDPVFGSLADFDALLERAHALDLRVLLDLVPNHSSDQHPWFVESRSSRDNPKRDWYIWRDPAPNGGPPNNWMSHFGGPAWTLDPATGQYYLHSYLKEQPDLNWRSLDLRAAMFDAVRFWLDRGVDGFRVDAIHAIGKAAHLRDEPPNPDYDPERDSPKLATQNIYSKGDPLVYDVLRGLRRVLDEYDGVFSIAEISSRQALAEQFTYAGPDALHTVFNFALLFVPWTAAAIRDALTRYEASIPPHIWPGTALGNHDIPRLAARIGPEQTRVAAMLLLTLRGTPFLYAGDEIGMAGMDLPPHLIQDPASKQRSASHSRDNARMPMQWDAGPQAGFTQGEPWLPVAPDYPAVNVAAQRSDTRSLLHLYRWLIRYRRETPALLSGTFRPLDAGCADVFAYLRETDGQRVLVVLNFSGGEQLAALDGLGKGQVIMSTEMDRAERISLAEIFLRGHEGCVIELVTE